MTRRNLFVAAVAAFSLIACGPELEGEQLDLSSLEQEVKAGKEKKEKTKGNSGKDTTTSGASSENDAGMNGNKKNDDKKNDKKNGKNGDTSTPAPATYEMRTTDARIPGQTPVWGDTFSIRNTLGLHLATVIEGALSGHHTATVFVNTPDGMPFSRFEIPFATDVPAADGEQQAEKTESGYRVWTAMPVAGTLIESRRIAGTWSASVYLDNATSASASTTFTLY